MRLLAGCFLTLVLGSAVPLRAQQITLQLPSFSSFSVQTTVVVPDRGTASLGGNTRMATGVNDVNGIPRQRAIGLNRQTGGQQVMAQIHDPQEADAALLGQGERPRARKQADAIAAPRPRGGRAVADPAMASVAQLERERAQRQSAVQHDALSAFEKGRAAQAAGKPAVAKAYYRTAAKQADPMLRQAIDAELRRLAAAQSRSAAGRPAVAAK